jgi:ParB/RepB/Spo0J family partition protein
MEVTATLECPTLPLSRIRPGRYNPRRHFDDAEMAELTDAVRAAGGIIQPILVRPVEDGVYEIIAGERRYRAADAAFGKTYEMPVLVKEVDDETASAMAIMEIVARADALRKQSLVINQAIGVQAIEPAHSRTPGCS